MHFITGSQGPIDRTECFYNNNHAFVMEHPQSRRDDPPLNNTP